MAVLPTYLDLKSYLRVQTDEDDELLVGFLQSAQAVAERYINRPFGSTPFSCIDEARTQVAYGRVRRLMLTAWPFDPATLRVEDADGVTVDATTYRTEPKRGLVVARKGIDFPNGPYTLTANVGLETLGEEYTCRIAPLLRQALLELGGEFYTNRTPGTTYESVAGGTAIRREDKNPIPLRTRMLLDQVAALAVA